MRWTLEILVFLVFAGMALPIIWRMRGLSILRSALSHEPLYMRVAAFAFFAAMMLLEMVWAIYFMPETKGRPITG